MRTLIEIVFKEDYFQRQIAKKLKISIHGVQYSLQGRFLTGANVDRKRPWAPKVTNAAGDKDLIIERKRNRRKTAPELRVTSSRFQKRKST